MKNKIIKTAKRLAALENRLNLSDFLRLADKVWGLKSPNYNPNFDNWGYPFFEEDI